MEQLRIEHRHINSCFGTVIYGNGVEDSGYRRAFLHGDLLCFQVTLPRQLGAISATAKIRSDTTGEVTEVPLAWTGYDGANEVWKGRLAPKTLVPDLYFLRVDVEGVSGRVMTVRTQGSACTFQALDTETYTYQLTICEFSYNSPEWLKGGVVYHVFVDRFCREGEVEIRDNAILNEDWEEGIPEYPAYPGAPLENNVFFGGTLMGVTSKLPYIASLGVNCIYLSPIFEAYSNHKYDTGDYMTVDPMFGGEEALVELISEAKKYGIRIVLDGVFNHTGDDSIYFNKWENYDTLGAYQGKQSPYYEWYDFKVFPNKYACWWDIPILPRLNPQVPSCHDFFLGDEGVIAKYAKMGIGGFRLDVVDELPAPFVEGVKERLSQHIPDNILWGEVWEDASNKTAYGSRRRYFQGKQLDGVMNYELRRGIISYLTNGDVGPLRYALCEVMPNTPKRVQDLQMNLLGTHDTLRILTALGGKDQNGHSNDELAYARMTKEEYAKGVERLKMAYLILATVPGIPHIYYGDEVGMQGYSDPFNRMPFPWHKMDEDILSYYRKIGEIRTTYDVWKEGEFRLLHLDERSLIFVRLGKDRNCLIAINRGNTPLTFEVNKYTKVVMGAKAEGRIITVPPCTGALLTYTPKGNALTLENIR